MHGWVRAGPAFVLRGGEASQEAARGAIVNNEDRTTGGHSPRVQGIVVTGWGGDPVEARIAPACRGSFGRTMHAENSTCTVRRSESSWVGDAGCRGGVGGRGGTDRANRGRVFACMLKFQHAWAVPAGQLRPVGNRDISASSPLPEAARGRSSGSFCAGGSVFRLQFPIWCGPPGRGSPRVRGILVAGLILVGPEGRSADTVRRRRTSRHPPLRVCARSADRLRPPFMITVMEIESAMAKLPKKDFWELV